MQVNYLLQRNINLAKGVRVLNRLKQLLMLFLIIILVSLGAGARDYIELWPEGWSEVSPLFNTSIFADRFFVVHDQGKTSFLSADGVYFKELDLTYRVLEEGKIVEELVISSQKELDNPFLGLDEHGMRHILWLERSPGTNTLKYTSINTDSTLTHEEPRVFWQTQNTLQDLAAYQHGTETHLVWTERDGYFQVHYGLLEDGQLVTWEPVTNSVDLSVRPSVIVDKQDRVHVAWMESGDFGVEIHYSMLEESGWTQPIKIGDGSVQDIEQAGRIAMTTMDEAVIIAWSAIPRNASQLYIFSTEISKNRVASTPAVLARGSRAKFVSGTDEPQLIWQGIGGFGAEINHGHYEAGSLTNVTNLTVGRKAAFRPEAIHRDDFLYVYWLQAHPERGFTVYGINNQYPKALSFWRKVGIDETAPFMHLFFLFISTFMLAAIYVITNIGVLIVGGVIFGFLQRFDKYRKQSLFYQTALISIILTVVNHLPIPSISPEFFGLIHYGISFMLATVGTYLIMRNVRQKGFFPTLAIFFIWMFLFQFFSLIPQNILQ